MKSSVLALLALAIATTVHAEGPNEQQRLAKIKDIKLQGIEGRLSVLKKEAACIQTAPNMEAFKSCDEAVRLGMRQVEEQQKAGWESLKASNQQGKDQKKN